MILSRKEFHLRWTFRTFDMDSKCITHFPIFPLLKEIKADAPFRNHNYLFDGSDLSKIACDDEIGVNKYCGENVKTEAERIAVIDRQIKEETYKPISLFQDGEHPSIIFIDDGFHRVYSAWKQGLVTIKADLKMGQFKLEKVMPMEDLPKLLGMLEGMFPKELHDVKKMKKFLEESTDGKKMKITSIGYGKME